METDADGPTITCAFEDLGGVSKALEASLGDAESVNTIWKPQTLTPVDEDKASTLMKLLDALDDDDDVQNVYSNEDIEDAVMERLSA